MKEICAGKKIKLEDLWIRALMFVSSKALGT